MPTLNSDQLQDQASTGSYLPSPSLTGQYATYTFDQTEANTFEINMFPIKANQQVLSLVMEHDALGDVTLTCGPDDDTDAYIQSESGVSAGTGWLGQGVSVGKQASSSDRDLHVKVTKNSGNYTLGAKVLVWAILATTK